MSTDASFHPKRRTLVLRAKGEGEDAKAALSELCATYYAPVVAFLHRNPVGRRDEGAAREMAHAFSRDFSPAASARRVASGG